MSGEIMETRMRATLAVAVLVVVYPAVAFAQLAPQSQAEFEQRFTGWALQSDAPDCNEGDGIDPITFIEPGRFDVNEFFEGDYEYERTGANTGTLTVTSDFFPIPQVIDLTFNSQTMGTFTVAVFGVACEGSFEFVESTPEPQTGEQIYYFPHLAVGEGWQTTITYINYSPQEVTCQTEFLSDHGSPLMVSFAALGTVVSRTDVLPPGGSVHQETNVDLNASLAPGWARATCSGPVQASLLYRLHNSEGAPTAEAGVNATAVPATRFVTFAEQGEDQFGTGVAYANPSPNISVPVTFTARDGVGEVLASVVRTLSPGGHDAHVMAELFGLSSFTGSLEVTSTEPIVSLSLNFEAAPVFSSLPPGDLDAAPAIPGEMPAPADDRAALEALYDATNGANWSRNDNWKTDEPLGQWFGVRTNSDGRVTRLDLSENQLSGTIPAEIGNLPSLTDLFLGRNQLSGMIPAEIGNLTSLEDLALHVNQLSGTIPAEIGNLPSLTTLSISFNQLSGTIPVEIGNLTSLEHLLLGSNQLSGTIPAELGNLTRLISLGLENNQLSGTIPAEIGNLTSLFALRVDTDTGLCLAPDFDLTSPFATRSGLPVCSTEP